MTWVLIRKREETDMRGECLVTTEAEIKVLLLQTKECSGLLANQQKLGRDKNSPLRFMREHGSADTLTSDI